MGIHVNADSSLEGLTLKKDLEDMEINSDFVVRWGNWNGQNEEDTGRVILNSPQAIKNTLDKETAILTLRRYKLPCPKRIKPGKKTDFPILGRKYQHKSGTDICIIDSLDEVHLSDCDYYLEYLHLIEEYSVHVMDLEAFFIEEKVHKNMVQIDEPIIRSRAYGWESRKTELTNKREEEKSEIINLSIKAVYGLGLDFGVVSIGKSSKGKYYILDVDATCKWMSHKCKEAYILQFTKVALKYEEILSSHMNITIGADPECLLKDKNKNTIICASEFFTHEGKCGLDARSLESGQQYFPLLEIRPKHSLEPVEVFQAIEDILTEIYEKIHYANIGLYSGSMPIYNYWLGGHIHFGTKPNGKLIRALDNYLALPMMMIERSYTSRQRKKTYGVLGNYRLKSHGGFEYCTLCSWLVNPLLTKAILCLAKVIVQEHLNLTEEFLCDYSDIRAFYLVNKLHFRDKIKRIITHIENTETYVQYHAVIDPLFFHIRAEHEWEEEKDIKEAWGLASSDQLYTLPARCFMPKRTRRALGLKIDEVISIRIGKENHPVRIYPKDDLSSEKSGLVSFSEDICRGIGIKESDAIGIYYDASSTAYRIGPILGIFAYRESHYLGPFGLQTFFFRKLLKLSKTKGLLAYVFTIWDIDWRNSIVGGYIFDVENDEWVKQYFPLPHVIYDRGDVVTEENYGQYAIDYLEGLKNNNIKLINSIECINITNNKWTTYTLLGRNNLTNRLQPETWEYESNELLLNCIDMCKHVFLKMKDGSRSKGIFSIEKLSDDKYGVYYKNVYGYNVRVTCERSKLADLLDHKINEYESTREDYVIQRGISMAKYMGHNFEIRVLMQKNSNNIWLRTSMVARIIQNQEKFLDVWNEGNKKSSEVLSTCFGEQEQKIANAIRKAAQDVVGILDREGIQAGEIAIDFVIDEFLNIYVIELNSKPDNLLARIGAFKMRNLACNRILEYGKFLAILD